MAALTKPMGQMGEFYQERLIEAFRYTRALAAQTGRRAEDVVETPAFAAVLAESPEGSLEAARRIGEMAVVRLDAGGGPGPWWRDLCAYERAYFLQAATTDPGPPTNRPRRGVSALCANFSWFMPELLHHLGSGQGISESLRRNLTLLFSRDRKGKVFVVEVGAAVEKVFRATNGLRTLDQIAAASGVTLDETQAILSSLAEIGAVASAVYSDRTT